MVNFLGFQFLYYQMLKHAPHWKSFNSQRKIDDRQKQKKNKKRKTRKALTAFWSSNALSWYFSISFQTKRLYTSLFKWKNCRLNLPYITIYLKNSQQYYRSCSEERTYCHISQGFATNWTDVVTAGVCLKE